MRAHLESIWRVGSFVHAKLDTEGDYGLTLSRTGTKLRSFTPASRR